MRSDVAKVIKRIRERRGFTIPYSPETAREIVTRLAEGETLTAICACRWMPHIATVYDWRKAHPDFARAYENALAVRGEVWADDCIEIADDASDDFEERTRPDGSTYIALRAEAVARSKLRIATRLDLLERTDPRYSRRQSVSHTGTMAVEVSPLVDELLALLPVNPKAPTIEGQARLVRDEERPPSD